MSHDYRTRPEHAEAFRDLCERINEDIQPHGGWVQASQLPRLTLKDFACILRANPDTFDDIRPDELDIANALESGGRAEAAEAISVSMLMPMEHYLRCRLLEALQSLEETIEVELSDLERYLTAEADSKNNAERA